MPVQVTEVPDLISDMKIIEEITEDQMIAGFLKAETSSSRWGEILSSVQRQLNVADSVLTNPDIDSGDENAQRKGVLAVFRGYGENKYLFVNFPKSVRWVKAHLSSSEVLQVKYANLKVWNELSQNSRLPSGAAGLIRKTRGLTANPYQHFLDMEDALHNGAKFPELILVATDEESELIALEGHARLTTYALAPDFIPSQLEVIIGLAPDMALWQLF